jgi:hypothetical protein
MRMFFFKYITLGIKKIQNCMLISKILFVLMINRSPKEPKLKKRFYRSIFGKSHFSFFILTFLGKLCLHFKNQYKILDLLILNMIYVKINNSILRRAIYQIFLKHKIAQNKEKYLSYLDLRILFPIQNYLTHCQRLKSLHPTVQWTWTIPDSTFTWAIACTTGQKHFGCIVASAIPGFIMGWTIPDSLGHEPNLWLPHSLWSWLTSDCMSWRLAQCMIARCQRDSSLHALLVVPLFRSRVSWMLFNYPASCVPVVLRRHLFLLSSTLSLPLVICTVPWGFIQLHGQQDPGLITLSAGPWFCAALPVGPMFSRNISWAHVFVALPAGPMFDSSCS